MASVRLHVLLRAPLPGKVKTRLAAGIGHEAALALYRAFAADVVQAVDRSGLPALFWVDPGPKVPLVRDWLGAHRHYAPQPPGDLGRKLDAVFAWSFLHGDSCALALGSDVPQLTPQLLALAADRLQAGQAVLGPSPDGGYWCIGFTAKNYRSHAFVDMPWSTAALFDRTLSALDGLSPALLPQLADIDTSHDLAALAGLNQPGVAQHTCKLLAARAHDKPGKP